jgi:nitric oxide reductase activation protein
LGAALRHATLAAGQETTERRAVIVLTDGAPSDIDVFDPDYLIADAARAVSEARATGVQVYGLVMDAQARPYAEAVYGLRARQILEHPEALPRYLSMLYQQIRR